MSVEEHRTIAAEIVRRLRSYEEAYYDLIKDYPTVIYLEPYDFHALRISLGADLDWHADTAIDFEPRYCKPFPAKRFDKLWERKKQENLRSSGVSWARSDTMSDYLSGRGKYSVRRPSRLAWASILEGDLRARLGDASESTDIAFHGAWCERANPRISVVPMCNHARAHSFWLAVHLECVVTRHERYDGKYPSDWERELGRIGKQDYQDEVMVHKAITLYNNEQSREDVILFSEVVAAINVIRRNVSLTRNWGHVVYPVFVHSFYGSNVRMLQFHLDIRTSRIYLRKTPFLHIKDDLDEENIKLFLRWKMNVPIGDTWLRDEDSVDNEHAQSSAPRALMKHPISCR